MTLLIALALAASPEKAADLIEGGKPAKAAKVAAKQLDRGLDTVEEEDAWRLVLADATVAVLREQPDLILAQWFLMEFPRHPAMPEVRELEASLALDQAQAFGTEAVYLGLGRQYASVESGQRARRQAEELHYAQLENSPEGLRRFLLRYARGEHADEVRGRELASAVAWAEEQGSAEAWKRVMEGYPKHPQAESIRERYRQAALGELTRGGATPDQLWRFAGEFSASPEGQQAAQEGLTLAPMRVTHRGVPTTEPLRVPVDELVFDLGSTPPSGFEVLVEVEVEGQGWAKKSSEWAPALGLPPFEPQPAELARSGSVVTWTPHLPLCSPTGEALTVTSRVVLAQGEERRATREQVFQVTAACEGAQRMVFSRLEDDLEGPLAVLAFDPVAGAWELRPAAWSIPEDWDCSHATDIDVEGVTVVCGTRTVRAGWDGHTLWARPTEEGLRRTERAPVEPLDDSVPLSLAGKGARTTLKDPSGTVLATVGTREVILTVASPGLAFGATGPSVASPAIPADMEKPMPSDPPLPEGAVSSSACPRLVNVDGGRMGQPGRSAVTIEPEVPTEWGQIVMLDQTPGTWTCFEYQGHAYARTATTDGSGTVLLTLRADGRQGWLLEETRLP